MTEFNSLVSRFASESGSSTATDSIQNDRKRSRSSAVKEESDSESTNVLVEATRNSLRLQTPVRRALSSRTISADSIRARPHHKRANIAVEKKEEEEKTVVSTRVKSQGRNPAKGYTPPEVYSHLALLPDIIDYDLDVLWVGINPGVKSSERSHHFSGPTNHFWPCLNESGLLPPGTKLGPESDRSLPELYRMGLTNLVDRPSRSGAELSVAEARAAAPILMAKIKKYRPRFVCFVSKQAWEMFAGVGLGLQTAWVSWDDEDEDDALIGAGIKGETVQDTLDANGYRMSPYFDEGPGAVKLEQDLAEEGVPSVFATNAARIESIKQELDPKGIKLETNRIKPEPVDNITPHAQAAASSSSSSRPKPGKGHVRGSRMFVTPSTSGRVTQYRKEDKLAYFKQLAELVRKDRALRGL